jgi:hypothetical protein
MILGIAVLDGFGGLFGWTLQVFELAVEVGRWRIRGLRRRKAIVVEDPRHFPLEIVHRRTGFRPALNEDRAHKRRQLIRLPRGRGAAFIDAARNLAPDCLQLPGKRVGSRIAGSFDGSFDHVRQNAQPVLDSLSAAIEQGAIVS